ncbi:hypothetical protein [Rhizobium phage RHph_I40]|uniref:Uncharacterized protein n=1 Tax=Rhizobium phage RHph_I38 TaxID=2509734 RepID=A0A7S5R8Q8_9CAUD|nr:hypothetical protein EVC01_017 [Rhizobium phage RHph_I38]QXV73646.1 hypothetical protein [Rhizobium phage RHph_I40]
MARIRTSDGRLVDPLDIQLGDVRPRVIIHSLSQINRFTGHATYPFSVAQHTYNLYRAVPKHLKKAAILHDFSEAWFNDLASPLKRELPNYRAAEKRALDQVLYVHGVTKQEIDDLDEYDKRIYKDERNALFPIIEELGMGDQFEPLGIPKEWLRELEWRHVKWLLADTYINEFSMEMYCR